MRVLRGRRIDLRPAGAAGFPGSPALARNAPHALQRANSLLLSGLSVDQEPQPLGRAKDKHDTAQASNATQRLCCSTFGRGSDLWVYVRCFPWWRESVASILMGRFSGNLVLRSCRWSLCKIGHYGEVYIMAVSARSSTTAPEHPSAHSLRFADWPLSGNRDGRYGHGGVSGAFKFEARLPPLNSDAR